MADTRPDAREVLVLGGADVYHVHDPGAAECPKLAVATGAIPLTRQHGPGGSRGRRSGRTDRPPERRKSVRRCTRGWRAALEKEKASCWKGNLFVFEGRKFALASLIGLSAQ